MSQRTYDADKVDGIISELTGLLDATMTATKSASADTDRLLSEIEMLKKASTPAPVAVAADETIKVDPLLVKQASAALVEASLYDSAEIEKLAKSFEEDPNTALHIVMALAKDSIPAYSEGKGIAKEAAVKDDEGKGKYTAAELAAFNRVKRFGA